MALQLIDLNADVSYIEVDVSRVPYSFTLKLSDKTFVFTVDHAKHLRASSANFCSSSRTVPYMDILAGLP